MRRVFQILLALLIVPGIIFIAHNNAYAVDDGQGGMMVVIEIKGQKTCPDGTKVDYDKPCPEKSSKNTDKNNSLKQSNSGSGGKSSTTTQSNTKKTVMNNKSNNIVSAPISNRLRSASVKKIRSPIIRQSEDIANDILIVEEEETIKTDASEEQNIPEETTQESEVVEQVETEKEEQSTEQQDSGETTEDSANEISDLQS